MSCSIPTLLTNGKEFQKLSERDQQLVIAQLLCDISQSGLPWVVVFTDGTAVGPDGVINTTGTTTNGIQEAINSLPAGDATSRFAGGGVVLLRQGAYSCSGQIIIPNAQAFNLRIEGVGKAATIIKYTGSGSSFITTTTFTSGGPFTLQLTIKSLGITHLLDTNNTTLLKVGSVGEMQVEDCVLCPDVALAGTGNRLEYSPGPAGHAVGTEGIRIVGGNQLRVSNSAFWGLARGITLLYFAHGRVENTYFDSRDSDSLYSFSTDGDFFYPKSYMVMAGTDEIQMHGCFFNAAGAVAYPLYADSGFVQAYNCVFASCSRTTLIGPVASGGAIQNINPSPGEGPFAVGDYQMDNAGTITAGSNNGQIMHFLLPCASQALSQPMVVRNSLTEWLAPQYARVTTSDSTRTAQTLADITGLSIVLDANGVFEFEAVLSVTTSADTAGTEYAVQYGAAGAAVEAQIVGSLTSAASKSERISALNTATSAFLTTSAQSGQVLIKGVLTTGANASNLTIQHLKVTSGTSTVKVNSFLKARRIA